MISVKKLNAFLFVKLPSAFWCGVRVKEITDNHCMVSVKHRWINQNPFQKHLGTDHSGLLNGIMDLFQRGR